MGKKYSRFFYGNVYAGHDKFSPFIEETKLNISSSSTEELYYGVFIPKENTAFAGKTLVFTEKCEALKLIRENREARFKAFTSEKEAMMFSKYGGCRSPSFPHRSLPTNITDCLSYKRPKYKEIVEFRKAIQSNDLIRVRKLVFENPRYLVGSGDTPTILQEGPRYNAAHVAAIAGASEVCSFLLRVITNTEFIQKLYGTSNLQVRSDILLDLFLNMPDKGLNETPLHFASKLCSLNIVKTLLSYQQCDRLRKNKYGLTAADVVCTRARKHFICNKKEILALLDTNYFVPLLRAADNSLPPVIGEPFNHLNPPTPPQTKVTPPMEVRAIAGPMPEDRAKRFRREWKRSPRKSNSSQLKYCSSTTDPEKDLENVGRILANKFSVQWKEYWLFLDSYHDLVSSEGLNALENYLKDKFNNAFSTNASCHSFCEDLGFGDFIHCDEVKYSINKGIRRRMNRLSLSPPRHHKSNTKNISDNIIKLSDFESVHNTCPPLNHLNLATQHSTDLFSDNCYHVLDQNTNFCKITDVMEKSCQLYAARIAFAVIKGFQRYIFTEILRFQIFLASCILDIRFNGLDFRKCHYRIASFVTIKILSLTENMEKAVETLNQILLLEQNNYMKNNYQVNDNTVKAATCISKYTVRILSTLRHDELRNLIGSSLENTQLLWKVAEACDCGHQLFNELKRDQLAKTLFVENNYDNEKHCDQTEMYWYEECQTDLGCKEDELSDDTFYTVSNSSSINSLSSSPLFFDDDDMHLSESGPDVFLFGEKPTKIDKAVLNVLGNVHLPLESYPHVVMWKLGCQEYSLKVPPESWSTPIKGSERRNFP